MPPGSSRVKRQRRVEATASEVENQVASLRELDALAARSDGDLFLVDRGGSKAAKSKVAAARSGDSSSALRSTTERKLIQRIINNSTTSDSTQLQKRLALSDLWGDDEEGGASNAIPAGMNSGKRENNVKVSRTFVKRGAPVVSAVKARGGQSYNPEPADHQAILAEALALELKRKEEEARKAGPAPSMSLARAEHEELLRRDENYLRSNQSSSSDEEEDANEEPGGSRIGGSRRRKGKLTTAQRNRQRRVKQQSHEEEQARAAKRLEKDLSRADLFLKSIEEEHDRTLRNKQLRELKAEASVADPTALHRDEINAVPLSDELKGSLRRLTPRGGHIIDRVEEMRRAGELVGRDRKRRRNEKPHGARRVVWVPKYKST